MIRVNQSPMGSYTWTTTNSHKRTRRASGPTTRILDPIRRNEAARQKQIANGGRAGAQCGTELARKAGPGQRRQVQASAAHVSWANHRSVWQASAECRPADAARQRFAAGV